MFVSFLCVQFSRIMKHVMFSQLFVISSNLFNYTLSINDSCFSFWILNFHDYKIMKQALGCPTYEIGLNVNQSAEMFLLTILMLKSLDFPSKIRKSENKRGVSFSVLFWHFFSTFSSRQPGRTKVTHFEAKYCKSLYIQQGVSCDRFLGRTHAPHTSRFRSARTRVRTSNLKGSHLAPAPTHFR